jgi:CRP/FNR family transcriptional regulator, anaerobic regulatory protein
MKHPSNDPSALNPQACIRFLTEASSDCQHCTLRSSALFADLKAPDLKDLTSPIENGVMRRGSVIYQAGDLGAAVFTVRVGVVKLLMELPGRDSRIVRLLGRGATLGLEALAGRPYAHTAVTLRTTSLCQIPTETVGALHDQHPRLIHGLMDKWNEQVVWADRWIAILGSGTVSNRLADLVRLLVDISGDPLDAVQLPPVIDISATLGVSPESVSRHMADLKRAGLLTRLAPRTFRCHPALLEGQPPETPWPDALAG